MGVLLAGNKQKTKYQRRACFISFGVFMLFCLDFIGCQNLSGSHKLETRQGFYFDTTIAISVSSNRAEEILDECMQICAEKELIFSRTRENSELYQINHRVSETLTISEDMAAVIQTGLEFYEISEGMLDITMAPVNDLWDFKSEKHAIPDRVALDEALEHVDITSIHLEGNILTFQRKDTQLDLGAFAKGYIADCLKEYLVSQEVTSAQINLGGNVLLVGAKPDGNDWRVGIQEPFENRGTVDRIIEICDQSVVSSGIYEREFEVNKVQYFHILDPNTGYPVETDLAQATIVSESSLLGDAYSTTCILLGKDKAEELSNTHSDVIKNCILIDRVI